MKTSRLALGANLCGATHPCASASTRPAQSARSLSHLAAILFLALIGQTAMAASVNLEWSPNPETDIVGYKLSYGTSPGSYSTTLSAGTNTSTSVSGLSEGQIYYFVVKAVNNAGMESAPSSEVSYQMPVSGTTTDPSTILSTSGWSVISVSSQETVAEYAPANCAFDGNPATFWHSKWSPSITPPPHEIKIDLGSIQSIQGFRYLPRQDGLLNGTFTQYEFYTSEDGVSWGVSAAAGTLAATSTIKEVKFNTRNARYIWFRGLSEANGRGYGSIAELNILAGDTSIITPPSPANQAPVAGSQSVITNEDQTIAITLKASDPDGNSLSYRLVSSPTMGSLSGNAPNLTYTPAADANGSDSFTFVANDGKADSNTATVSITVVPVNDTPIAVAQVTSGLEDKALGILLSANDKDGDALTYRLVSSPTKGSLSGTAPNLIYTPNTNASGSDSLSFRANDGSADSNSATVSITISAVNDAPVAAAQVTGTTAGAPVGILLSASDADGDPLTFSIVSSPLQGSLSGTPPNLTYTPKTDATGSDSISFRASDGKVGSNTATVSINIAAPAKTENKAPVFQADLITRANGKGNETYSAESLAGSAVDPNSDVVTYSKAGGPEWLVVSLDGKLSGTPPAGAVGLNSFAIRASDPTGAIDEAVLEITILPSALPLPWTLGRIGIVSQDSTAWGDFVTLKLKSSGSLAGTADSGIFTWQTLSGDGDITARISALESATSSSRVGLEIRESLAPNAKHIFLGTDGSGFLYMISRNKTGGSTSMFKVGIGRTPNIWLRLSRSGNYFQVFTSLNGSTWSRVGKVPMIMGTSSYIGLMTSGGGNNISTGVLQDVTVRP
jgi:hypothetical protein